MRFHEQTDLPKIFFPVISISVTISWLWFILSMKDTLYPYIVFVCIQVQFILKPYYHAFKHHCWQHSFHRPRFDYQSNSIRQQIIQELCKAAKQSKVFKILKPLRSLYTMWSTKRVKYLSDNRMIRKFYYCVCCVCEWKWRDNLKPLKIVRTALCLSVIYIGILYRTHTHTTAFCKPNKGKKGAKCCKNTLYTLACMAVFRS